MASTTNFFTSSPSVAQPSTTTSEYFTNGNYHAPTASDRTPNGFGEGLAPPSGSLPVTPGSIAGRKRSRGDLHAPEDDEHQQEDGSVVTPAVEMPSQPRSEPVLGPGMTLIYPEEPAYEARPESQSGTWVEERAQWNQFQVQPEQRPTMSTRKSQRMDTGAAGSDDLAQLVLPADMREVTAEPLIDEATRTLGISWTRMDSTEPMRISQAAYQKWIQNHYPALRDVAIWFENSAIPGYLVVARNAYSSRTEYYIFSLDLTEARLVTSDAEQLIPRLQMLPALHLAAPGGCIKAESDPMVPERPKTSSGSMHYARMSEDYSMHPALLRGYFPSQEMDMD